MARLLEDVKREFEHIYLDIEAMNRSLGIDLINRRYIDLNDKSIPELFDLTTRSVMWEGTLNSTISDANRAEAVATLEADAVYAKVFEAMAGGKSTEVRVIAKGHPDYVKAMKKKILLNSYLNYLKGAMEVLKTYHYTVKDKIKSMKDEERKY